MLLHVSIAARDPERVASVLAEIWGGQERPCPHPIDGGWIAFADDNRGTAVEVYPHGHVLVPGRDAVTSRSVRPAASTATHFAMATKLSEADVRAIAEREGWRAPACNRGPYCVIEFWLENETLVEILTPDVLRDYMAAMTSKEWDRMLRS